MKNDHYTTGALAKLLGAPIWKVRRIVDSMDAEIPRVGQYRAVPAKLIKEITERLGVKREEATIAR